MNRLRTLLLAVLAILPAVRGGAEGFLASCEGEAAVYQTVQATGPEGAFTTQAEALFGMQSPADGKVDFYLSGLIRSSDDATTFSLQGNLARQAKDGSFTTSLPALAIPLECLTTARAQAGTKPLPAGSSRATVRLESAAWLPAEVTWRVETRTMPHDTKGELRILQVTANPFRLVLPGVAGSYFCRARAFHVVAAEEGRVYQSGSVFEATTGTEKLRVETLLFAVDGASRTPALPLVDARAFLELEAAVTATGATAKPPASLEVLLRSFHGTRMAEHAALGMVLPQAPEAFALATALPLVLLPAKPGK